MAKWALQYADVSIEAPRRNIPKAANRFIYRLMVFYILGSLVISVIVASNDDLLLQGVSSGEGNAGASPFVIGIKRAGIRALDHIINAGRKTVMPEL